MSSSSTFAAASRTQRRRRTSLMEATGRESLGGGGGGATDIEFDFEAALSVPTPRCGRRSRSVGGTVTEENPFPLPTAYYEPEVVPTTSTMKSPMTAAAPLNASGLMAGTYRGLSDLSDLSFAARSPNRGGGGGDDSVFKSALEMADLGLGAGGERPRSRWSPRVLSTVPRAWSDSSRPQWENRLQFFLAVCCLGCGMGGFVAVPLNAARLGGGGVHVALYAAFTMFVGFPLSALLCLMGQYHQGGPFVVFASPPGSRGIASAMASALFVAAIFKTAAVTLALRYLYSVIFETSADETCPSGGGGSHLHCRADSASAHRWTPHVAGVFGGDHEIFRWDLAAAAATGWAAVYTLTCGRLVLFRRLLVAQAGLAAVLLVCLFVRGASLGEGTALAASLDLFAPAAGVNWGEVVASALKSALADSLLASGAVVCLASFNPYGRRYARDLFLAHAAVALTTVLGAFFHFSVVGSGGTGRLPSNPYEFAFDVLPSVLALKVASPASSRIWLAVYFAAIVVCEINQNAVVLETLMSVLEDLRPAVRPSRPFSQAWVVLGVFGLAVPLLAVRDTAGTDLYHSFACRLPHYVLLLCVLCYLYFYGAHRLAAIWQKMFGQQPPRLLFTAVLLVTSAFVAAAVVAELATVHLEMPSPTDAGWVTNLGWVVVVAIIMQVPLYAGYRLVGHRPQGLQDLASFFHVPELQRYHGPKVVFNRGRGGGGCASLRKQLRSVSCGGRTPGDKSPATVLLRDL